MNSVLSIVIDNVMVTIMSTPLAFPAPRYVKRLKPPSGDCSLRRLCRVAGVNCRASGPWTQRVVWVVWGPVTQITAEASPRTGVEIHVAGKTTAVVRARYALAAMAYLLMDGVARESLRGVSWARPAPKPGRPKTGRALSVSERQRRYLANHD